MINIHETPFEKVYHVNFHLSATGKALLEAGVVTKNLSMVLPFLEAIIEDMNKQDANKQDTKKELPPSR